MTSLSMRGLVENPYELELRPTRGTGRKPHPLGSGIERSKKWLSHPDGSLVLPTQGPSVEQLMRAREECLPRELEDFAESAWAGLIAYPQLAIPLAEPVDAVEGGLRRSFGLVTVYKRPDEHLTQAGLMHPRMAATSWLTIGLAKDSGFIETAALRSEWHMSSSALLGELEVLYSQAMPDAVSVRVSRRITVLVDPGLSERLADDERTRLAGTATLLDSALDLVDRARMDKVSVERRLAGSAGGALVVVGPMDSATRRLRDIYVAVDPDRLVRHVPGGGHRDLSEALLDHVMELSGVSGSLLPIVPADKSPKRADVRARIPITNPVACLHHGDRFYVRDGDTGLWWTRDNDRHAGTIFKTYQERDSSLDHEADRDADGGIINKHKGPSGAKIPRSELRGCPKAPHKHLG